MSATEEPRVRPAEPGDLDRLTVFQLALAWDTEGKRLDATVLRAGLRRLLADPERGRFFVAERGGVVVGSLMVTREWSDWRDGWFWWIQSVYTAPEARGGGVYRRLHEHVRELARAAGDVRGLRLYVEVDNAGARAVYDRVGMHETSYRLYEQEL